MTLFEAIKKYYFWIAHLIFLAVAAYLSANIVASIFQAKVGKISQVALSEFEIDSGPSSHSFTYYQPILDRNIFNSNATPDGEENGINDVEPIPLDLQLKGTVVGDKEDSLAIIKNKSNRTVDLYHVGDEVAGATLLNIQRGSVTVEFNGETRKLPLQDIKTASVSRPSRRRSRSPGAGIVKRGRDRFEVPATVVDNAISDMGQLMRQARIKPHRKNGSIDGFKIYRIKRRSLFRKIGLRNGDIIHRINGMDLRGPEQGLQAFEELRSARNIQLDITRRGKKRSLNYTIK